MEITENQIVQLSPDANSTKAGKKLATPNKWVARSIHKKAIWGACQGSGKNPYTTMVDTVNVAFKCSCPSRKFPCKHALGILFLYASSPEIFQQETTLADHVAAWIGKRETRTTAKATKAKKPVDEKAQQKRIAKRQEKVEAGVAELSLWLKDLVHTGIMNVPQNAYQFTNKIAARMVDAQAPGLATKVQAFSQINFYEEGWQKELLQQVAKTYLLTTAYQQAPKLSDVWQEELKTQIGWNTPKEKVLKGTVITDEWLVLSRSITPVDRLRMEKVWLYGKEQQRFALLLNFYANQQIVQDIFLVGSGIKASLHFYPGLQSHRALIKEQTGTTTFFQPTGLTQIDALYDAVATQLGVNPFLTEAPFILEQVCLRFEENVWYLQDKNDFVLALKNTATEGWKLMAASLGQPFTAFVNYHNSQVTLETIMLHGQLISRNTEFIL